MAKYDQFTDKIRLSGGRFTSIYKATRGSQVVVLKVFDIDDCEIPPHSLKIELALLRYINQFSQRNPYLLSLLDLFVHHDDRVLVFPFYPMTLTDYFKKNSRIKTNMSAFLDSGSSCSLCLRVDPIDDYFDTDDADGFEGSASSSQVFSRLNKINVKEALQIICKIFKGFLFLHSNGIIHRDIKPDNIMLDKDKNPVIIDFGISYIDETKELLRKQLHQAYNCENFKFHKTDEPDMNSKHTDISTGVFKPPEAVLGLKDYGTGVDIWSFGIVITQFFSLNMLPLLSKSGNFSDIALLNELFKNFGTPDVQSWPKLSQVEYFQNFSFLKRTRISIDEALPYLKTQEYEFFKYEIFEKMMVYDEEKRLTAEQALAVFNKYYDIYT